MDATRESGGSLTYPARHSESGLATSAAEPDTALLAQLPPTADVATKDIKSINSCSWNRKLNAAGLFGGLLLAALLLVKGYHVEHAATRPIEDFRPGQRAIVDATSEALAADVARLNGLEARWKAGDGRLDVEGVDDPLRTISDATREQITRADYRLIILRATEVWPDGTVDEINVQTLQPWQWIQEYGAHVGGEAPLPLDAEEMGLDPGMHGTVLDILPCPEFEPGRGRIVLTTVNHLNRDVRGLTLRAPNGRTETLRPTGSHKFYSVSRGEWLSASELQNGERLDGIDGVVNVVSSRVIPGTHRVYNFTVQGEHLYRVANCGVLVHNANCWNKLQSALRMGSSAASAVYRNMRASAYATYKGALSKVAHNFTKHAGGQRIGSSAFPRLTGNDAVKEATARAIFEDIMTDAASTITVRPHSKYGQVIEIMSPKGQGAKFDIFGNFLYFFE